MHPEFLERYWSKMTPEPNTGCWLWIGTVNDKGYGRLGRKRMAHKLSYEYAHNLIVPENMEIDHLCRMSCCVNPDHLEMVSHGENMRRARSPFKNGFCWHGHSEIGNVVIRRNGQIDCRLCGQLARRKYNVKLEYVRRLERALEDIIVADTQVSDGGKVHDHGPCAERAIIALAVVQENAADG